LYALSGWKGQFDNINFLVHCRKHPYSGCFGFETGPSTIRSIYFTGTTRQEQQSTGNIQIENTEKTTGRTGYKY